MIVLRRLMAGFQAQGIVPIGASPIGALAATSARNVQGGGICTRRVRRNRLFTCGAHSTLFCNRMQTLVHPDLIAVPATNIAARAADGAAKPQKGRAIGIKAPRDARRGPIVW